MKTVSVTNTISITSHGHIIHMFLCRPGLSCGGGGADWLNPAVSASGASCHLLEVSPPAGPPPEVGHPHFMGAACCLPYCLDWYS